MAVKLVSLEDLTFDNHRFWAYYLSTSYPRALLEETDQTMYDLVSAVLPVDTHWSDEFTQYYDGVLDDSDGYLDEPTTFCASLGGTGTLKIEFHPGDTIFYLNDEEIGCTGPHWELGAISYETAKPVLALPNGPVLFQLLLPMISLTPEEAAELLPTLEQHFTALGFASPALAAVIDCLFFGIVR